MALLNCAFRTAAPKAIRIDSELSLRASEACINIHTPLSIHLWDILSLIGSTCQCCFGSFGLDALNATNHTNFAAPNTDPTSTTFGTVTSTNGASRVLQLNMRLEF